MSIATQRERRKNAGSKMSKLLEEEEEEDEFYKTAYGGFVELEEDNEFVAREEDYEEDYVDSDFDADENADDGAGAGAEEDGDDEFKRRRATKRGVQTKAYKVCVFFFLLFFHFYRYMKPHHINATGKKEPEVKKVVKSATSASAESDATKQATKTESTSPTTSVGENKTLRVSTAQKRRELEERQKKREKEARARLNKQSKSPGGGGAGGGGANATLSDESKNEMRRLTQEELLAEAKLTEAINLASLGMFLLNFSC